MSNSTSAAIVTTKVQPPLSTTAAPATSAVVASTATPSSTVVKAESATAGPSETVSFFVSFASTQTVIDGTTTNIMKTQTFATIRPIMAPSSASMLTPWLLIVLLHIFK